eukprot:Hpha_TRINITY_DN16633_c0_g3::TRINITY_DN16633_c0_g3_i1::g.179464::m.179464
MNHISLLFNILLVGLVSGGEPDCSLRKCIWKTDNYKFGDAWWIRDVYSSGYSEWVLKNRFTDLLDNLCDAENWRAHDNCMGKCPLALVPTSPSNISMRACLTDNSFNPFAPNAHIDLGHHLNEKELDFIAMGTPGSSMREACEPPTDGKAYSGKIVLVKRGSCAFVDKVHSVTAVGGLAAIIVDHSFINGIISSGMVGPTGGIENTPAYKMSRELGDIILAALDEGAPVKGKLSLDCSVMIEPPPPATSQENCPHQSLFGMCGEMSSEEKQLCARCAVQFDIAGTNDTPCLYGNRLLPRDARNTLPLAEEQVHLASLVPEFDVDPNCQDDPDFVDPYSGITCADVRSLINAGTVPHCGMFFQYDFPLESHNNFLEKCLVTCPKSVGGKGCPGGTGEGCDPGDFKNAAGKIMAIPDPQSCSPFEVARYAESMGVKAIVFLARGSGILLLEGLSKFVGIPVHALDYAGHRAFVTAVTEAHESDSTVTGVTVRIGSKPPSPPEETPAPTEADVFGAVSVEASKGFTFTALAIVALIFSIIFFFVDIGVIIWQRLVAVNMPKETADRKEAKRGFQIPLSAASTLLSLSLLFTIAIVAFSLTYVAGKDTTDQALDDGWSAVEKTHNNAVGIVAELKDTLMSAIVGSVGRDIEASLKTGQNHAQMASQLFMTWDGTWDDFDRRLWQVTEFWRRTSTLWKLAVRTTNGFFAATYLKTDDRPNITRADGLPHVSVSDNGFMYGVTQQTYKVGGGIAGDPIPRDTWEPAKSLGRMWGDANAIMYGAGLTDVTCMTVQQTVPVPYYVHSEFGLRPLSCLSPIYDADDNYLGTIQAHTKLDWFGSLLGSAVSKETQNLTIVVFNNLGEVVVASKGRDNRIIESYGDVTGVASGYDSMTVPIVLEYSQEPYLNAAANYMKGAMGLGTPGQTGFDFAELGANTRGHEFDQKEWYAKGLWTRYVVLSMDFEGGNVTDISGE